MKLELEQQLVKTYPEIFSQYGGDPKQTLMAFGMECGDGWFDLIDTICKAIQNQTEHMNYLWPNLKFRLVAVQVKEKYGTLRFYNDFIYADGLEEHDRDKLEKYINQVNGMVSFAEFMSGRICEVCGQKGSLDGGSFPRCRCKECENKEKYNRLLKDNVELERKIDENHSEIEQLRKERDDAMEFVCGVANDVNTLSTRPKDSIRFSDLVYTIQVWGDNANEMLKKKENTNGK